MKDSVFEQEVEEDEAYFRDVGALKPDPIQLFDRKMAEVMSADTPAVELWDGEVVRRDTAITYLAELNSQQVDK